MITILVAEDDRALNKLVCTALEGSGYRAVSCPDGLQALAAFEENDADMLVTDIMMPGLDGFGLAERVRESDKKIPILFMTALDDKPAKLRGYALGADDYVVKPFDPDILLLRVGALVLGVGMCLAMEVIGSMMPLGIVIGAVGIAMVTANYFLYRAILRSRKKKYAKEIVSLSDELLKNE